MFVNLGVVFVGQNEVFCVVIGRLCINFSIEYVYEYDVDLVSQVEMINSENVDLEV